MTLTPEEIQEIYELFGAIMLSEFMEFPEEFPLDLTLYDKDGKIYTMMIDLKQETLQ